MKVLRVWFSSHDYRIDDAASRSLWASHPTLLAEQAKRRRNAAVLHFSDYSASSRNTVGFLWKSGARC
jgi:hypothetical protein